MDQPVVVSAVLRPLDPSVPSLREGCLHASTSALRILVQRYAMMAFHQGTQRLAVGTVEGVVVLYDLRTATKWRILQGHERARPSPPFIYPSRHPHSVRVPLLHRTRLRAGVLSVRRACRVRISRRASIALVACWLVWFLQLPRIARLVRADRHRRCPLCIGHQRHSCHRVDFPLRCRYLKQPPACWHVLHAVLGTRLHAA